MNIKSFYEQVEKVSSQGKSPAVIESAQGSYLTINGKEMLNFCSSHYLGLATNDRVKNAIKTAVDKYGVGTGYRTIAGTHVLHIELENAIARFKNYFSNGTQLYKTTASSSDVTVMASKTKTMIVNHLGTGQTITVNGASVTLSPYQVAIIDTPSITATPSTTISQGKTTFSITLCPHGMGSCGDNVNASGIGNTNPVHTSRNVTMTVLNAANQPVTTAQGSILYNQSSQNFQGSLATNFIASGQYLIAVKIDGFLGKTIPGIVTVIANQTNVLPSLKLVAGDVNNDNQLDILDYNSLISCFGFKATTTTCQNKIGADINDDGTVNGVDYNLFLRELSVQIGN